MFLHSSGAHGTAHSWKREVNEQDIHVVKYVRKCVLRRSNTNYSRCKSQQHDV